MDDREVSTQIASLLLRRVIEYGKDTLFSIEDIKPSDSELHMTAAETFFWLKHQGFLNDQSGLTGAGTYVMSAELTEAGQNYLRSLAI